MRRAGSCSVIYLTPVKSLLLTSYFIYCKLSSYERQVD